jgi:hypothetical protein
MWTKAINTSLRRGTLAQEIPCPMEYFKLPIIFGLLLSGVNCSTWFQSLFGFDENSTSVRNYCQMSEDDTILTCSRRSFQVGKFHTPTVAELRKSSGYFNSLFYEASTRFTVKVTGDILKEHAESPNATFQAASQFNALETGTSPALGITRYEFSRNQGPSCALACPAGTLYRNYFVKMPDGTSGQTETNQINNLGEFLQKLNELELSEAVYMSNGILISNNQEKLKTLAGHLRSISEDKRDELVKLIRVGLQEDVEVSFSSFAEGLWEKVWVQVPHQNPITVSQVYAAAPRVGHSRFSDETDWEPLAQLILDAQYEATVRAAFENYKRHPGLANSNLLYLTAIGGGQLANKSKWIASAIRRAVKIADDEKFGLDIVFGLFQEDSQGYTNLLQDLIKSHLNHQAPQLSATFKYSALALICLLAVAIVGGVMIARSRRAAAAHGNDNDDAEVILESNEKFAQKF